MQRREFIKTTTMQVAAVSAYGFIRLDGNQFVGDCETTTDILGPFYRPDAPVRSNLAISGDAGEPIELSGLIRHKDCITPYKNAKIELWHCDSKGKYDNQSNEYRYRGTTYSNEKGYYSFQTILPVPYDTGDGNMRPAHFHLMITAVGYQPLVTQLYFNGDPHIKKDPYASAPTAIKRTLDVQKLKTGITKVTYNVGMSELLHLEAATLDRLVGHYSGVTNKKNTMDLFKYNQSLWMKNEAFGNKFEYAGNNTFEEADNPKDWYWKLEFEFLASGAIQITERYVDSDTAKKVNVYLKDK
ncbi:MAG: catechol 1,2-dioxygenase [Saprospiraceae bacterium]